MLCLNKHHIVSPPFDRVKTCENLIMLSYETQWSQYEAPVKWLAGYSYSGTSDKGQGQPPYKGRSSGPLSLATFLTSEKRTTSQQRRCPLFRGSYCIHTVFVQVPRSQLSSILYQTAARIVPAHQPAPPLATARQEHTTTGKGIWENKDSCNDFSESYQSNRSTSIATVNFRTSCRVCRGSLWFVCMVSFNVHLWHTQTINFLPMLNGMFERNWNWEYLHGCRKINFGS